MTVETESEYARRIEEVAAATRVTNALLLARAMRLDMTEPVEAQKVLRHLSLVEQYVGSDSSD